MYEIFEQLLKEHGVTAYRVSKETGVTTATLTSWKQGKYTPKPEKLQKIADYFGVSLSYLMTGKDEVPDGESPKITLKTNAISLRIWKTSWQNLHPVKLVQQATMERN